MNFVFRVARSAALAAFISLTAKATPISASMNAEIRGYLGSDHQTPIDSASWGTLGSPLSVATNLLITGANGDQTSGFVSGNAQWSPDGNSGSVTINYAWSNVWSHTINGGGITPNGGPAAPNWSY